MLIKFNAVKSIFNRVISSTKSCKSAKKELEDLLFAAKENSTITPELARKFFKVRQYRIDKIQNPEVRSILGRINDLGLTSRYAESEIPRLAAKTAEFYEKLSPEMQECVAKELKKIKFSKDGTLAIESFEILERARLLSNIEPEITGLYRAGDHSAAIMVKSNAGYINKCLYPEAYENNIKFNSLQRYIKGYNLKEPELCNKLYKKYYLSQLDGETSKILAELQEKFNVKVFLMHNPNKYQAEYIYREIAEYAKTSKGKAKLPHLIDVNKFANIKFADDIWAGVYHPSTGGYIAIAGVDNINYALRHEIMHGNHHMGNAVDFYIRNPLIKLCKKFDIFRKQLSKGGIDKDHIPYAYTNFAEAIAVTAEGNGKSYNEWYKYLMRLIGMPKWGFNLSQELAPRCVSNSSSVMSLDKATLVRHMLHNSWTKNQHETYDYILQKINNL